MLFFSLKKQTSKSVADTVFELLEYVMKVSENIIEMQIRRSITIDDM